MRAPEISVLVPVYGVEKYIERCARSLFNQTLKDGIEFIFVDDATPDNSIGVLEKVIEDFPERHSQIQILRHGENKGLAVARVTGVEAARGNYVAHCDSDDWVEPDMYETMLQVARKTDADIVVCDYYRESYNDRQVVAQKKDSTREEITSSMLRFGNMHPFLWIRLIRRSFYLDNEFFADPKITFCEDLAVTIPMHLSTDRVAHVAKPLYHYNVVNAGSMTQERSKKKIESCRLAMDCLETFIVSHNYKSVMPALNERRFRYFFPLIIDLAIYDPKRWLELDNPDTKLALMPRSRLTVWLVRHRMFGINWLVQFIVKKLFNR